MSLIDKILTEWAYRVHDGMPNPKNPLHLVKLQNSLDELNLPRKVTEKLLQNLRELEFSDEGDFQKYKSKHKMRKSTKVNIGGKETTVGDVEGDKEGLSQEQLQKEKAKNEYLHKIADLFVGASSEEKGHGRFRLSREDVKQYQEHLAKPTEQLLKEQKAREQEREKTYGKITHFYPKISNL